MVTANSRLKIIERFVLEGTPPTIEEICNLGIDVKILENKLEVVRPQLDGLSGYKVLEKWCSHKHLPDSWSDMVAKANLTGTQCVRFEREISRPPYYGVGLIDTDPGINLDIEVFLTRKGQWIVWARSGSVDVAPKFTVHDTVSNLLLWFRRVAGTKYDFTAHGYDRDLHYWPDRQNGDHRVVSVALLLAAHLDVILRSSLWEKNQKLLAQQEALEKLNTQNTWAGIPIITPVSPSH